MPAKVNCFRKHQGKQQSGTEEQKKVADSRSKRRMADRSISKEPTCQSIDDTDLNEQQADHDAEKVAPNKHLYKKTERCQRKALSENRRSKTEKAALEALLQRLPELGEMATKYQILRKASELSDLLQSQKQK